ncbi:2-succinyl-5-enolpyruvyl-6-hydroxy-3-cyclohexene-1-carboxylic-acid synthase [Vibrio sp. ZSDE26]|uniref:2-succinyl-5-enolpyruvyl-6-hydroxy-3-cyclohexene-1-carboxylate synthase n=1 Tax=Vibrio amylolyticus TaxID=2847292 RepID=A0A9X1XFE4_9VIBR|nr:2-succinyl-5-enolpyruvyl-6-hydroxy-3-cyclohexene-1-carboxylic-acid synthase [Vibrio amylolyticus]MCK6262067.1 2-succinyl-5-enolpyruvyl-6-hydroxy-3-cyclohexene-1-carboxylic-acid synthase [Vibrio amylolyticus]
MMPHQAVMNRIWCETVLEELTRFGVTEVCIAPGSRSTPLTLEADLNPKLNIHTHFDERGLGFLALGMAKASKRPVAIIVTSGTAVANLLPAIAEAKLTGEKLVVLSADRPQQLVGCGANQAIEQRGLFSNHVTRELSLPSPSEQVSLNWLLTSVDDVLHQQARIGSAVHINCPFPEPLYSDEDKTLFQDYQDSVNRWKEGSDCYTRKSVGQRNHLAHDDLFTRKGLIVIGSVCRHDAINVLEFAAKLGWPVLCDPQSGVSSDWAHYDLWLQNLGVFPQHQAILNQCDVILQFGSRVISKRLNQWLEAHLSDSRCDYYFIDPSEDRNNQAHLNQIHYVAPISDWLHAQLNGLQHSQAEIEPVHLGWADALTPLSHNVARQADRFLVQGDRLTELSLAYSLGSINDSIEKDVSLFFGNSLFIRLVDMFSALNQRDVYTNRGASGIDGLIATASGVLRETERPLLMFIGDTSLLYDLNSLALLTHQKVPMVIVVTNNDGGAIFDLLPVPEEQKKALYQMPHGYQFDYAAKQFGLAYDRPTTLSQCVESVTRHLTKGSGALIVEVLTTPGEASNQLKEFQKIIHAA